MHYIKLYKTTLQFPSSPFNDGESEVGMYLNCLKGKRWMCSRPSKKNLEFGTGIGTIRW